MEEIGPKTLDSQEAKANKATPVQTPNTFNGDFVLRYPHDDFGIQTSWAAVSYICESGSAMVQGSETSRNGLFALGLTKQSSLQHQVWKKYCSKPWKCCSLSLGYANSGLSLPRPVSPEVATKTQGHTQRWLRSRRGAEIFAYKADVNWRKLQALSEDTNGHEQKPLLSIVSVSGFCPQCLRVFQMRQSRAREKHKHVGFPRPLNLQ